MLVYFRNPQHKLSSKVNKALDFIGGGTPVKFNR